MIGACLYEKTYKIEVDCANCANKMEIAAGKVPGVRAVTVNFLTRKVTVTFAEDADVTAVMKQVEKVCRKVDSDCVIEL